MAIKAGDVKLVASAVMADVPEGGGAPSSHIIEDNKSNEIFKDISESDRARGRLNMAKVFVSVQTEDVDTYLGSNVIVGRPPEDPNVSITLFTNNEVYDVRSTAQSRIEAYLNKSSEWGGYLFENHIVGQGSIQLFQRVGAEIPPVGKTLCLIQNEGLGTQREQYVQVARRSVVERTFTYNNDQDYKANIVTLELSAPLRYDFTGSPASRLFTRAAASTITRDTLVANAASYAGVVPLAEPIALGDLTIRAGSVYTSLVPSAQSETPIPATAPYANALVPAAAANLFTYATSLTWNPATNLALPIGITPGTLSIAIGATVIADRGGLLVVGALQVGTVDYANGILTTSENYAGVKTVTFRPAAYTAQVPQSMDTVVTAESRSLNYVGFVNPLAAPATLKISYMVQNQWYVLSEDGSGAIRGFDASYGAGNYTAATGDYQVTLGALPDVGSSIIVQWGVPSQEYAHPTADLKMSQTVVLPVPAGEIINPAFFRATWTNNGQEFVATSSANGIISGAASGTLNVNDSSVTIAPNSLPIPGTEITYELDVGEQTVVDLAHPSRDGAGRLNVNAGSTALVPGSVVVEWNTLTDETVLGIYTTAQLRAMGIGLGAAVDPIQSARDNGTGGLILNGVQVGTVNYSTGAIVFSPDVTIRIPSPQYTSQVVSGGAVNLMDSRLWRLNYTGLNYVSAPSVYPNDESGWVKVRFYSASSSTRKTHTAAFRPSFPLVAGIEAQTVPGSVLLQLGSLVWGDSGTGSLREFTSAGWVERGRINYATNTVDITSWPADLSSTARRSSLVTTLGTQISSAHVFRTAAAPLRPGSLSIQYALATGGTAVVTADIDGSITGAGITGSVDYQTGVVRLGFGSRVVAAGNESEPWYDPSRVGSDGRIFRPDPATTATVKYTAVAYTSLPLNAELLGIDPVRLPSDGRVPIFKAGTMVVIGNTKTASGITPTNGMTVNLARTRLSRVLVRDSAGRAVYEGYTADLEAGTVTFTDVTGIAAPVSIDHRIEDMALANDVQISGQITFTRRISHDYPVEGTYVSSALEFGDRFARVSGTFDQATWDGVTWLDAPSGAVATATYNTVLSPIEVTNFGASTERFALWFTSTTQFRIIGEHIGQIGTGDINTVCAPINPATGKPYFTIRPVGWGTGWATGNVLRLNTVGALAPVWVVRTVQAGEEAGVDYSFDLLTRGDVDRP